MSTVALLHFAEYDLQIIALSWMAVLYAIKVYQMWHLPMPWEVAPGKGSPVRGIFSSYAATFLPWTMESSRKHFWRWIEFSLYHLGAAAAIFLTFSLPFAPGLISGPARIILAVFTAPALVLGVSKFIRRLQRPEFRLISTPDDYFSLATLECFFAATLFVLVANSALSQVVFFFVTAWFLFYVPFSKISHYVYYLFAGVITGSRLGWRGVRPAARRIA